MFKKWILQQEKGRGVAMSGFETLAQGFVTVSDPNRAKTAASGPRCVVTDEGDLLCSYMLNSGNGINDFIPTLARSSDLGTTWTVQGPVWPGLTDRFSIFASLSKAPDGTLFLYGFRTPIDTPGESFWQGRNHGMKQNELIWSRSADHGRSWTEPCVIDNPSAGSVEAPGPLWVSRSGEWMAVFAPYHSFDEKETVDRNRIVFLKSADEGKSWSHTEMLKFPNQNDGGAEAWVVELGNGSLLGISWHFNYATSQDYPNAFSMSEDGGATWTATRETGTLGQSTALWPYGRDHALFLYNRRKAEEPGIGLALAKPRPDDFGIVHDQLIWKAERTTVSGNGSSDHGDWEDFAFGEPAVTVLPDGSLFVVFWFGESDAAGTPGKSGVRYLKLAAVQP